MYSKYFKRAFDLLIALFVIFCLSPLYFFITLTLTILNNGKPFFTQNRIGKNNMVFKLIKFKSMNDKKDANGEPLPDLKRLTTFGKFIRKYSLDELPQIFNVIKGNMSIVGPRPLLPEYLPYYSDYHIRRHEVRPGITGLAQVKGRNSLKFSERFNLDVHYVDNVTLILDIDILLRTFLSLFFKRSDIKIGRPISELDDVGISKGLAKNLLNIKEEGNDE